MRSHCTSTGAWGTSPYPQFLALFPLSFLTGAASSPSTTKASFPFKPVHPTPGGMTRTVAQPPTSLKQTSAALMKCFFFCSYISLGCAHHWPWTLLSCPKSRPCG